MSIEGIGTAVTRPVREATDVNSSKRSGTTGIDALAASDSSTVSNAAKVMRKLKDLQHSDPAKFKDLMSNVADKLSAAATSATDPQEKQALTDLAAKFHKAGESGDLSVLIENKVAGANKPRGGGAPPAGGSKDADATSTASSAALTNPADTNLDGKVSPKEQLAYAARRAAAKAALQNAQAHSAYAANMRTNQGASSALASAESLVHGAFAEQAQSTTV